MNSLSFQELLDQISRSKAVLHFFSAVKEGKQLIEVQGAQGSLPSLLLASAYSIIKRQFFVIVPQESDAENLSLDLNASGIPCTVFPWWGTAPYRELSPLSLIFSERVKALSRIILKKCGIVIIPQRAFLTALPPAEYTKELLITLKTGSKIDTSDLAKTLVSYGYIRVPRVQVNGEFALRGEVLDIFLGADDCAFRLLFDYDKIESIRKFDPLVQNTVNEKITEITLRPMKEVIWSGDRVNKLRENLSLLREIEECSSLLESLAADKCAAGEELFYPLAFDRQANILEYLDNGILVFFDRDTLEHHSESLKQEYMSLYMRSKREKKLLAARGGQGIDFPLPERILLDYFCITGQFIKNEKAKIISFKTLKTGAPEASFSDDFFPVELPCDASRSFFGNMDYLNEEFSSLLENGWKITVAAESDMQAQRIKKILEPVKDGKSRLSITAFPLASGFSIPDIKFMLVQENEIFGRRKRIARSLKHIRSSPIDTFVELNPGDYVVHVNHGIGLFRGIERKTSLGHERDYIHIEYAGEESVFVPVEQVNLVQRYIGNEGQPPRLDVLGSKSWENRKGRVKKSVEDIAEKLIELYSKRRRAQGFAFPKDTQWQTMFEAAFPFEETEDQLRCIEEIKKDMESPSPMDRLICGDVGFGKTEVAVRACFKAIMGGKQAAFLAPTTILCEQHYENFLERFSRFPVNIAMLSRFVDRRKTRVILEKLKKGEIDLLIGTHRIIQRDVQFRNLGLLVIDEEQRFGVKDKERLKELKTNVDCLTLSATPIPRTLHMSLVKIRDMSLLATAPPGRQPIETFVEGYDPSRIAQAIRQEVERGGQVFFLHNRIDTLDDTRYKLEKLLPDILIETAHGRMESRELESVMRRFIHRGFHVLVSTTIIENGIDIPNVNTIIIDRADMYGVSQLYQLRGRVGRSDRTAYAFLFYPRQKSLTEIAMKRLQTISDFTELGSGFKIAMKDMEIRGAGNLLGREQSGYIYSVGFDLYVKLLEEAVKRLEDANYEAETETLLELEYSGFIPDSYIDSPQEKMEIYKMIAAVNDEDALESAYSVIQDRFGALPDEVSSLLALAEIRIICKKLSVLSLKERKGIVRIDFAKVSRLKVENLVRMIQESSGKVRLDPKKPNVLLLTAGNIGLKEKSEFIREKLSLLA